MSVAGKLCRYILSQGKVEEAMYVDTTVL